MIDDLDINLLEDLSKDSRISYAELGRKYNLSRVCIRERINNLVEQGVIERFTVIVNPEKMGKKLAVFFEIEVRPNALYQMAEALATEEPIINIYMTTGSPTLYANALLESNEELEKFVKEKLYSKDGVLKVHTNIMLKKFKINNISFCP